MQRDLVIRAQRGDADAFSALTAGRTNRLYGTARLILRDDDQASDAVQDALLRAWLDLRALRDPDRFDAWMHRLLVRACHRAAQRERRRRSTEVSMLPGHEPVGRDEQAAVAITEQLDRGLSMLSRDHRAAIVLYHYLGLTLAESAEALHIPLGTMQSRLNRGTAAMRGWLDADERQPAPSTEATP